MTAAWPILSVLPIAVRPPACAGASVVAAAAVVAVAAAGGSDTRSVTGLVEPPQPLSAATPIAAAIHSLDMANHYPIQGSQGKPRPRSAAVLGTANGRRRSPVGRGLGSGRLVGRGRRPPLEPRPAVTGGRRANLALTARPWREDVQQQ